MNNAIITLHEIDGEPLVLDTDLAERLGMAVPRKIKDTIIANREELTGYGPLAEARTPQLRTNGATHLVDVFYLNEEQALLLCMLSRTPTAKAIRREVITVYQAWRKGKLQPAIPDFNDPIAAATAWLEQAKSRRDLEAKVAEDAPKVESWNTFRDTDASITSGNLAKSMGFRSAQALHLFLHAEGVIFPRRDRQGLTKGWEIAAEYAQKGLHQTI